MKKLVTTVLVVVMMATLFSGISFAEESYDIIYLTPSTASSFWSQVEVGILQAKADLEAELGITINYSVVVRRRSRKPKSTSPPSKTPWHSLRMPS